MSNSTPTVNSLFNSARDEGILSGQSLKALNVPDIGVAIQAALGVPAIDVSSSEVFLVTLLVDDSSSIRFAGNSQIVRDGVNMVIDSLVGSKQKDTVLICIRYLNGEVICPFVPLSQAVKLTTQNYNPNGGTPLYDETAVSLGAVLAKTQEFRDQGQPVHSASLVITDGHDEGSNRQTENSVSHIVRDLLRQEIHIVAAMGIDDGQTDFRQIFSQMGFEDKWILTPSNTQTEIRRALGTFSQSAVRASQGAASFSKTALGGFTV